MPPVRVRFAPSPTGFFHIGSARTALFNWLYARHTGGTFILRIEDTDQARNSEEFLQLIYDSLTWLGLDWDEGPNPNAVGERGTFGPYRQSQRGGIYKEYLQKLLDAGRAYEKDGAIWFKLIGERYKVFDDHRKKEVEKVKTAPVVIDDRIRGRVERQEDEDFVIVRSDGNPVFHFVNVVDDITMQVTHIIRGEDHLSNTSKHMRLYEGFGVTPPVFAHIPLILKSPEMGQGKMSKRDKGALIEEYRQRFFLPEAIVNYLSLLGWNPGDDREKMPIADIIRLFDLPGVNQSNAKFDGKKLAHMNMLYLLEKTDEEFLALAREYFEKLPDQVVGKAALSSPLDHFQMVMKQAHPKIKSIDELAGYTAYFFTDNFPYDDKVKEKIMAKGDPKARLAELIVMLPAVDFSSGDAAIEDAIKAMAAAKGLGFGDYQAVARLAMTGTNVGPSITSIIRIFGKERTQARLQRFLSTV
jgi:nondiscriminating glutamyl-tRNA synthetase